MRFSLLDRVTAIEPGRSITAVKAVTLAEEHLHDHFPGAAIVPNALVLEGLARHKDELGGALCPCRHYEDKQAEVAQAFWNCPCVPMRERKECHCMLFLTEDNPFRGEKQTISLQEVQSLIHS